MDAGKLAVACLAKDAGTYRLCITFGNQVVALLLREAFFELFGGIYRTPLLDPYVYQSFCPCPCCLTCTASTVAVDNDMFVILPTKGIILLAEWHDLTSMGHSATLYTVDSGRRQMCSCLLAVLHSWC